MRASRAPEKWQLILDAVNKNDYDLANKLAVRYKFAIKANKEERTYEDIRHTPLKGDYVAQSPDGKMYCHVHASAVSTYLGLSFTYVGSAVTRIGQRGTEVKKGKMKGWKFWQEK